MNVPIAALADYANVTAGGKLNILGIFDIIYGASLPVEVPSMRLAMQLQTEPSDRGKTLTLELKLYDAAGPTCCRIRCGDSSHRRNCRRVSTIRRSWSYVASASRPSETMCSPSG